MVPASSLQENLIQNLQNSEGRVREWSKHHQEGLNNYICFSLDSQDI